MCPITVEKQRAASMLVYIETFSWDLTFTKTKSPTVEFQLDAGR